MTEDSQPAVSALPTRLESSAVVLVLLLAGYLRLANTAGNPGWYSDEGTLVSIAANMIHGRIQDFALKDSTLLAARLPLYPLLASLWFRIADPGIPSLRLLSGFLGVITSGLLYAVVRSCLGRPGAALGVAAAFVLAVYPSAVVYSRMGFSYNLLAPLALIGLWGAWRYLTHGDRRALAVAALAVGLGCVTDVIMVVFLVLMGILVSLRRVRDLTWSIGLAVLPLGIYSVAMLTSAGTAFLFDVQFTASRLGAVPLWAQPGVLSLNLAALIRNDAWIAPAIVGLFMLRPMRWRKFVVLTFFFPIIAIGRSAGLSGLRSYLVIPMFPLVALGVAGLLVYGVPVVHRTLNEAIGQAVERWGWAETSPVSGRLRSRSIALGTALGVFLIAFAPVLVTIFDAVTDVQSGFRTPADSLSIDPQDARPVSEFVNERAAPGDLVIASPAFGWLLDGDVADLQQVVAAAGGRTIDYPNDVPAERFAYNMRYQDAAFVVVDRVWDNWASVFMPDVRLMQSEIEHLWPLVLQTGEFRVYENPSR